MDNQSQQKAIEILKLLNKKTVTPGELNSAIISVIETVKDTLKESKQIAKQGEEYLKEAIDYLDREHANIKESVNNEVKKLDADFTKKTKAHIKELLSLIDEVKKIEFKDGENGLDGKDGKDADEEKIIELVIAKLPKDQEDIIDKVNKSKKFIEAERVKGLLDFVKESITKSSHDYIQYRFPDIYSNGTLSKGNVSKINFVGATVTNLNDMTTVTITGGGGGAVDSVNGQTGVVVLDTGDIADTIDARYVTDADLVVLANTSGVNTGDQNLTPYFNKSVDDTDDITEGATNKFNATHTGDVTGATTLTVDKTAITGKTGVTPVGADYILISDTSDSGNLKKALVSDLPGGSTVSFGLDGEIPYMNVAETDFDYSAAFKLVSGNLLIGPNYFIGGGIQLTGGSNNIIFDVGGANQSELSLTNLGVFGFSNTSFKGNLDFSSLGADQNYTFPSQSGTIALTSDIAPNYSYLVAVGGFA